MSLENALMVAVGTLASVVVTLAGVVVYLWKELRSQYRLRAKDSSLFLNTLGALQRRLSERAPVPDDRLTPQDPIRAPRTGFETRGSMTSRTRG